MWRLSRKRSRYLAVRRLLFVLGLHLRFYFFSTFHFLFATSLGDCASRPLNEKHSSHCRLSICSYVYKLGRIYLDHIRTKSISINGPKRKKIDERTMGFLEERIARVRFRGKGHLFGDCNTCTLFDSGLSSISNFFFSPFSNVKNGRLPLLVHIKYHPIDFVLSTYSSNN